MRMCIYTFYDTGRIFQKLDHLGDIWTFRENDLDNNEDILLIQCSYCDEFVDGFYYHPQNDDKICVNCLWENVK